VREAVNKGILDAKFQVISFDMAGIPMHPQFRSQESIISLIADADFIIVDITFFNTNLIYEFGIAKGLGKNILNIAKGGADLSTSQIYSPIDSYNYLSYDVDQDGLSELSLNITKYLDDFRRSPARIILPKPDFLSPHYFIEWNRLPENDIGNLCRELLAQMGFQRLEWLTLSEEVDLVDELPRKDPDGFEYRELWLISMGLKMPIDYLLDKIGRASCRERV